MTSKVTLFKVLYHRYIVVLVTTNSRTLESDYFISGAKKQD